MFRSFRQLKISLATKCQLLFGVAVVLVICAALFVPWQRMEQLSEQPNASAARLVADQTIRQHVDLQLSATTRPSILKDTAPATRPTSEDESRYPRMIGIAKAESPELSRFELQSMQAFIKEPERRYRASLLQSTGRFRYAQPLLAQGICLQCHATEQKRPATTGPSTHPTPLIDKPTLIGMISIDIPSQTSGQQQLLNRVLLLIAGLIAGALAGVTLYLIITRIILKPVRVLQETAEKVSAGDLNVRSHISSGDEFQQLSETINQMLGNLKSSQDKLRELNRSLDTRLGQLSEANVALFESNKLKSDFIANVSHELRTPLNSILGFADLLKDSYAGDTKQGRYLQNIINGGSNLMDLINDLLDLAKIEAGKMEIRVQQLVLADLFEGLITLLRPISEKKKITIEPEVAVNVPIMQTDATRLQQILYNFLSNAIKFSPEKSTIRLTAEATEDRSVKISVIDQGPGIEHDKQSVIFEKFRQADQSHTRQHGGTGLGLAIARELTQLLGGTIGVVSEPGHGAAFWCILPVTIEPGERSVNDGNVMK